MEQLYSIGTTNRYAMFIDEEDDPGDVIVPPSKDPPVTTKTSKTNSVKDNIKSAKVPKGKENKDKSQKQNKVSDNSNKTSAPERVNSASQRSKQGPRSNGRGEKQAAGNDRPDNRQEQQVGEERGAPRGPRGQGGRQRLSSRDNDRENTFGNEDRPPRGGRGTRPFRGGGRGGQRSGKREFERRSGSDKSSVKAVDKREGGGAHNWGKQDEATVEDWPEDPEAQQDPQEPIANGESAPENKEKLGEGEGGEAEEAAVEEEDASVKEMTLDEYKAQRNVETLKADTSLQRNVDNSQWKDTVALKKEDAEFFPGTREIIEKPKTSGRVKTTLDPNFYFKDQARRGRGRTSGPRGGGGTGGGFPREDRSTGENRRNFDENRKDGGRGGTRRGGFGGRGQGRFNNRKDRAPNVEDESDFPLLGAA